MAAPADSAGTFPVPEAGKVSRLLRLPATARLCLVLAHGAGAGMRHPFLSALASELADRDVATFRYQFPYMERRTRRPDPPAIAEATVRAAVREAARLAPGTPLIVGGKSFGGRMTSVAQAREPLPGVRGIAFLGFPLHPAGKPSIERGKHLSDVRVPMLFLQGANDKLADLKLLRPLCARLPAATLHVVDHADHSFHVPVRTGRGDAEVRAEIENVLVGWANRVVAAGAP
ncbi:MAG TPA: alpha/beta family hydrolase [Casimicrobiaceae bacterium]|nr:alpha/beta family hydrolase [Casimicrobiaceae bacterium]